MIFFSGLMLLIFGLGVLPKLRNRKEYLVIVGVVLSVISGLRHYSVGVDSLQYYNSYRMIANLPWSELGDTRYELGYAVMCKLLSYFSLDRQFLFIATSIVINCAILFFIYKYSPHYWLSAYLYISLGFYYNSMNLLRQSLAMCIILMGIPLLLKRKYILFIPLVLLASQFHSSAIVALLLLPALEMKNQRLIMYGGCFTGIIGFLFGGRIFSLLSSASERYSSYGESDFAFTNYFATAINTLIALVILVFYLYSKGFIIKGNKERQYIGSSIDIEEMFLFVLMAYFIIELASIKANILERTVYYFSIFSIIAIPRTLDLIRDMQQRKVFLYLIIVSTYVENMVILYFRPNWSGVVPFRFYR